MIFKAAIIIVFEHEPLAIAAQPKRRTNAHSRIGSVPASYYFLFCFVHMCAAKYAHRVYRCIRRSLDGYIHEYIYSNIYIYICVCI